MKLDFYFTILAVLLQLNIVLGVTEAHYDKDCYVKNEYLCRLEECNAFSIMFFMALEDQITIQVSFVDLKDYEDNDLLFLNTDSGNVQRKRGGVASIYEITLNNDVPVGWNVMTINVHENKIDIGTFYTLTGLENKIFEISISATFLNNCTKKTPMWNVKESDEITIPLSGHTKFGYSLYSKQPFMPDLIINDLAIPLSYDKELVYRRSNKSLPPNEYHFDVVILNDMISIYVIPENGGFYLLMKAKIKEDLLSLKVKTMEGEFILTLDPFIQQYHKEECKVLVEDPNIMMEVESTSIYDHSTKESHNTPGIEAPSSNVWKVTTGLSIGIAAALMFIIIIILYRNRARIMVNSIEEGEGMVPLLTEDPIKDRIKSDHTELQGETNLQINPLYKKVYQLKLNSCEGNVCKKMLGDLDPNKPTKVILVVGESRSGKSSFINAMVNFIYGVEYDDHFRFKLVAGMGSSNAPGLDAASELIAYYVPYMFGIKYTCNYIFIDTPGFGDSRSIHEDTKWNTKFYNFLNKNSDITDVDGICFVIKATETRLTVKQNYIIDGLFSMFGRDIKYNIFAVVSYSDGSKTHVPKLLQKSGLDYNLALHFDSNGLYNDGAIGSHSTEDIRKYFMKSWELTMKNLEPFLNLLMVTTRVNLSLTTVVLEENEDINKIRDEILNLMTNENHATYQEKKEIESRIEQNQELLMIKLDEAQKLSGRLENIPAKKNPLVINKYIDTLIQSEANKDKKLELQKLKERNVAFQNLLKDKQSTKSITDMIFGEKTEKTE